MHPRISLRCSISPSVCQSINLSVTAHININENPRFLPKQNKSILCKHVIIQKFHQHEDALLALWALFFKLNYLIFFKVLYIIRTILCPNSEICPNSFNYQRIATDLYCLSLSFMSKKWPSWADFSKSAKNIISLFLLRYKTLSESFSSGSKSQLDLVSRSYG